MGYLAIWWLSTVHLVHSDNELFHSKGVGQQSVLSSLSVLTDPSLKLTSPRGYDEHRTVSLKDERERRERYVRA